MQYLSIVCFYCMATAVLGSSCQSANTPDRSVMPEAMTELKSNTSDSLIEIRANKNAPFTDPFPLKLIDVQEPLPPFNSVEADD